MLVCNVSILPKGKTITADLAEIATADDASTTGSVVFATLVDDPASVGEIVDAYLGEIMLEPASADTVLDAGLAYAAALDEIITAAELQDGSITAASASTWNPSDKSTNVTLSNGNLTSSASTSAEGAVRSTSSKTSGKIYFEVLIGGSTVGGDDGCGIATGTATLTNIGPSSGVGAAFVLFGNGYIYVNGGSSGVTFGTAVINLGNRLCIAVDLANSRIWFRVDNGNWNNNAANNPATNTGGINISALFPTNSAFAVSTHNSVTNNKTINFGATAFTYTVPSGFVAWG